MSFLLGPVIAGVGAEVASATGINLLGTAASSLVGAAADAAFGAAVGSVIDVNAVKSGVSQGLSFAQKIALIRDNKNNKEIVKIVKGAEALKGTNLDTIKDRSTLFVKEVSDQLLQGNLLSSAVENSVNDPVSNYIGLSIDDLTIIPDDPEYKYVSSVYDGSVFFGSVTKERFTNGNREFYTETERGTISWYFPDYNTYLVIPPLWGVWTGINSPNSSLPISVMVDDGTLKQSLLDRISHVHDCLYRQYGTFNKFADYILISYIQHGLAKGLFVIPGERQKALIAINYFSSLGKVMRKLYGGSESIYDLELTDGDPANDTIVDDGETEDSVANNIPYAVIVELGTDIGVDTSDLVSKDAIEVVRNDVASSGLSGLVSLINNLSFESD